MIKRLISSVKLGVGVALLVTFVCHAADNNSPGIMVIKKHSWSPPTEIDGVQEFTSYDDHTAYLTISDPKGRPQQVDRDLIVKIVHFINLASYPTIVTDEALKPILESKTELERIASTCPQAKKILTPKIQVLQTELDAYSQGKRKWQGAWLSAADYAKQRQADLVAEQAGSGVSVDGGSTLKTNTGQIYPNAKITKVEPDCITVSYDAGIAKIPFPLLSEEIRKKYGYDPERGKAYAAKIAAAQRELQQQVEARSQANHDQAAQDAQFETVKDAVQKTAFNAKVIVIQSTSEGARCTVGMEVGSAPSTMLDTDTRGIRSLGEGFVYNIKGEEDAVWGGVLFPIGVYEYTTVVGTTRSVNAYTTSFKQAMEFAIK